MSSASVVLEATSVKKSYRRWFSKRALPVLNGIDLQLSSGEIHALLGLNGAGKTTLIRLVLGLQFADSGALRVLGDDPARSHEWKKQVGYLPEQGAFPFAGQMVWTFLLEQAQRKGLDAKQAHKEALRVVEICHIEDVIQRTCGSELSLGQRRRVLLAQALLGSPRFLVLDEPFNGLDIPQTAQICDLFLSLRASGVSIFLSSHVLPLLERVCDRVSILKDGRLLSSRSPAGWVSSHPPRGWRFLLKKPLPDRLVEAWGLREEGGYWVRKRPEGASSDDFLSEIYPYQPVFWSSLSTLEDVFLSIHQDQTERAKG
jgi:ABC-2 type transport system ATP-binding protein